MKTLVFLLFLCTLLTPVVSSSEKTSLPDFARWLAAKTSYGVISTFSDGFPFGNLVSFADGRTGIPFFYLTPKDDATLKNFNKASKFKASFTVSEISLGSKFCRNEDPQLPRCSKLTLIGQLIQLEANESSFAQQELFKKHTMLKKYPALGKFLQFNFYRLEISKVYLLNNFTQATRFIPVDQYLKAKTPSNN